MSAAAFLCACARVGVFAEVIGIGFRGSDLSREGLRENVGALIVADFITREKKEEKKISWDTCFKFPVNYTQF